MCLLCLWLVVFVLFGVDFLGVFFAVFGFFVDGFVEFVLIVDCFGGVVNTVWFWWLLIWVVFGGVLLVVGFDFGLILSLISGLI